MSLRNSLVAFGISAFAVTGGGVALHEAIVQKEKYGEQIACKIEKYAGSAACRDTITTPEIAKATHDTQEIYSWIAGIGLIGGALGLIGAYDEATSSGIRSRIKEELS
jgi:hypothetical protein